MITSTRLAVACPPMSLAVIRNQGRQAMINTKDHRTTVATIAAVRTTEGLEFLAMNGGATVAAVPPVHMEGDLVHECGDCHQRCPSRWSEMCKGRPRRLGHPFRR